MVNMQNLQSQIGDSIVASGQFTGKKTDLNQDGIKSFLNILSSTYQSVESKSADSAQKKSDNILSDKNSDDMKSEDKTADIKIAANKDGSISSTEAKNGNEELNELAAGSTCAELLVMMATADGNRVGNLEPAAETSVTAVEPEMKSENMAAMSVDMNDLKAQSSETVKAETLVNASAQQTTATTEISDKAAAPKMQHVETEVKTQSSSEESNSNLKAANVDEAKVSVAKDKSSENSNLKAAKEDINVSIKADKYVSETAKKIENDATVVQLKHLDKAADEPIVVKVGDGSEISQQLTTKVADTVVTKIADNIKEFTISINPENLGRIDIKISLVDGKIQVFMKASHEATHRTLMGNENAIRQIIEDNTGQETSITFQRSTDQNSHMRDNTESGNGQGRDSRGGQRERRSEDEDVTSFIQQLRLGLVGNANI